MEAAAESERSFYFFRGSGPAYSIAGCTATAVSRRVNSAVPGVARHPLAPAHSGRGTQRLPLRSTAPSLARPRGTAGPSDRPAPRPAQPVTTRLSQFHGSR